MTKAKRMTLAEFKRICEARTKGEWVHDDGSIIMNAPINTEGDEQWGWSSLPAQYWQGFEDDSTNEFDSDKDGTFIAACSVMVDPLMRVVDAINVKDLDPMFSSTSKIIEALAALEASK